MRKPAMVPLTGALILMLTGFSNATIYAPLAGSFITTTTDNNSTDCSDPQPDNCAFYSLCLESRFHCGTSGYPLGYGLSYCDKFSANRNTLSTAGQEWMVTVMLCLQRALVPYADGSANTTCDALKDFAFTTHPTCYVKSGLCTLPVDDWKAIVDIVSLRTLFGSWDAVKATFEAAEGCAEFYAWMIEKEMF